VFLFSAEVKIWLTKLENLWQNILKMGIISFPF
jgi:hypothetical protein